MQRSTRAVVASRLGAIGTAGMILGLCLGFTSCGAPEPSSEEEHGAAAVVDEKELCRKKCNKDNCSALCKLDDNTGSQCTHHVPFCSGPNGFEDPKGPTNPERPPGYGLPDNVCVNTGFRSCRDVGNWRLVRQFAKRECDGHPGVPGPGSTGQCRNAIYDVWSTEQTAPDCRGCPCRFVTQRRCANGRLVGGDWGDPRNDCFREGADRAVCS